MTRTDQPQPTRAGATQYCTFTVAGLLFGVPAHEVQEVIRHIPITAVPGAPPDIAGLINLRGQIVTALDLGRRLGLPQPQADTAVLNVVIGSDGTAVSLLVDEIGGVVELHTDDIATPPTTLQGPVRDMIAGVHQHGNQLLLALDTQRTLAVLAT